MLHADPFIQSDPAVAYCGDNYGVVWTDGRFAPNYYWLAAMGVDTAGNAIDTSVCIGAQTAANEQCPDVAFDGSRCLVVWYNYDQPFGVYGRFLDSCGMPQDTVISVATTEAGYNVNPSIAFISARYLVVWADKRPGSSDLDICGQVLSMNGTSVGEKFIIATGPTNQMYPQVCSNGTRFLVVWRDGATAICGQWFDVMGNPVGSIFQISGGSSAYRFRVGVDAEPTRYLAAWSEVHDDVTDIYGSTDEMTGCRELSAGNSVAFGATLCGDLPDVLLGKQYKFYDVCGRGVTSTTVSRGVYFLRMDNGVMHKIVIVK